MARAPRHGNAETELRPVPQGVEADQRAQADKEHGGERFAERQQHGIDLMGQSVSVKHQSRTKGTHHGRQVEPMGHEGGTAEHEDREQHNQFDAAQSGKPGRREMENQPATDRYSNEKPQAFDDEHSQGRPLQIGSLEREEGNQQHERHDGGVLIQQDSDGPPSVRGRGVAPFLECLEDQHGGTECDGCPQQDGGLP